MERKQTRKHERGQGLVEYALILVLVAIVVIVVTSLMGQGVQRIFGLITGALGEKHNASGGETITIEYAECYVHTGSNPRTGLWIVGTTDVPLNELTGSTNLAYDGPISTNPLEGGASGTFTYNPELKAGVGDESLCPRSVVIQSKRGAIAVSPVIIKHAD
jgi:pilus assembly protein Flp/PilA